MALVWMDGFDKYGTANATQTDPAFIMQTRYQQRQNRAYTYAGRYGGYAITVSWDDEAWVQTPPLTTDSTIIVGFSMYVPSTHGNNEIFQLRSAYNVYNQVKGGLSLHLNADESLTLKRGVTTLGTSAAGVVTEDAWQSLEMKIFCDNTTGTYEIRINNTDVLSATGVDTQYSSDSFYDVVRFNGALASTVPANGVRIDDLWVCDGSGGEWTDFLGAGTRVTTLSPDNDGDWTLWSEQPSGNHYEVLDEAVQDDTNYVESSTPGDLDLYEYESVPTMNTLLAVQVVTETIATEPEVWSVKTVIKHAATEDADSGQVVSTDDWSAISRLMEKNPVTSNLWSTTDVDNLQVGIEVD